MPYYSKAAWSMLYLTLKIVGRCMPIAHKILGPYHRIVGTIAHKILGPALANSREIIAIE
jgi:hypothetical protein